MNNLFKFSNHTIYMDLFEKKSQNDSLNQGLYFNNLKKGFDNLIGLKRLNLIHQTTDPNLGNIESFSNANGITQETPELKQLNELETQFNNKLNTYSSIYKDYLTKLMTSNEVSIQYANTNVKDSTGKFYYVNEYGIARGYSKESWASKDSSCPTSTPGDDTVSVFNELQVGLDKNPGEPCNLDGKMIQAETTGNMAWITPFGYKQMFPNDNVLQAGIKNGCSKTSVKVTDKVFDIFTKGSDMTLSSNCNIPVGFTNIKNELQNLNNELIDIANQIYNLIVNMVNSNSSVETNVETTKQDLQNQIQLLNEQRKIFNQLQNSDETLEAEYQDNNLIINSTYYKYIIWSIAAMTMGAVAIHHMTN